MIAPPLCSNFVYHGHHGSRKAFRNKEVEPFCRSSVHAGLRKAQCGVTVETGGERPSEQRASTRQDGRLFGPLEDGAGWFDDACLFQPIVVKPSTKTSEPNQWRMYYYGREGDTWQNGAAPALITTGSVGMTVSSDGIQWQRYEGDLPGGAIFTARSLSTRESAFDELHVGCGDVLVLEESLTTAAIVDRQKKWWLFYFGGSAEEVEVFPGRKAKGFRMRCGLARSTDGTSFSREEKAVLDVGPEGAWDELFVAWPRIFSRQTLQIAAAHRQIEAGSSAGAAAISGDEPPWIMTYSAIERTMPPRSSIGIAVSGDLKSWTKIGKVLEGGPPGSWDEGGVSRRHVLKVDDLFVMFYEGVSRDGFHAIGVATSKDGLEWTKDAPEEGGEGGGPVFGPRKGQDAWDNAVVACPHVVPMDDGSFRMYYAGQDSSKKTQAIGVAVSHGSNFRQWSRYQHS